MGRESPLCCVFFFFNDTATTEIYTLSLHDALPISEKRIANAIVAIVFSCWPRFIRPLGSRSEEHTSELQSPMYLVCRLLLEKKKINNFSLQHFPMTKIESHSHLDLVTPAPAREAHL